MPQKVQVQGAGVVQFPDSMTPEEIHEALRNHWTPEFAGRVHDLQKTNLEAPYKPEKPLSLDDLKSRALSKEPVYSESRITHSPVIYGKLGYDNEPGEAQSEGGGFKPEVRSRLIKRFTAMGIPAAQQKELLGAKKGYMVVNPANDYRTTSRVVHHEEIHNVLDQAGVDFDNFEDSLPPKTLNEFVEAFNDDDREGIALEELPAYLAATPELVPSITPLQRKRFINLFQEYLNKNHPEAAKKYKKLTIPVSTDPPRKNTEAPKGLTPGQAAQVKDLQKTELKAPEDPPFLRGPRHAIKAAIDSPTGQKVMSGLDKAATFAKGVQTAMDPAQAIPYMIEQQPGWKKMAAKHPRIADAADAAINVGTGAFGKEPPRGAPLHERILSAANEIESGTAPVSIKELRAKLPGVSKADFDSAVMKLQKEGTLYLSAHDYAHSLSAADRELLVHEPGEPPRQEGKPGKGKEYNAVQDTRKWPQ